MDIIYGASEVDKHIKQLTEKKAETTDDSEEPGYIFEIDLT